MVSYYKGDWSSDVCSSDLSQWGPGAKPLVRGQGGFAPLKLTRFCGYKTEFVS
jgi:hypothetical protein